MRPSRFTPNSARSVGGTQASTYGTKTGKQFLTWANPEIVGGLP